MKDRNDNGLSRSDVDRCRTRSNRNVLQTANSPGEALHICCMPGVFHHHEGLTERESISTLARTLKSFGVLACFSREVLVCPIVLRTDTTVSAL
jgi:hypothetical protein